MRPFRIRCSEARARPPARLIHRSALFIPRQTHAPGKGDQQWLVKCGLISSASRGVFTFFPLGLRTLDKLEALVDREMESIGGQKLAMPLLLSSSLWEKTGRWESSGGELFRLQDRRGAKFCLGPTHEEPITDMIRSTVQSHKELPLRLYQIGKKYRDEMRPRFGLLRAREFIMKDMYSFDQSPEAAEVSYNAVTEAYFRIFEKLGLPFIRAEADSGNIGGSLSHEFQILADVGEDVVMTCDTCTYTANEEKATSLVEATALATFTATAVREETREKIVVAAVLPAGDVGPCDAKMTAHLATCGLRVTGEWSVGPASSAQHLVMDSSFSTTNPAAPSSIADVRTAAEGERCAQPACEGSLAAKRGIEVGHTFYLGTKYSEVLKAAVTTSSGRRELVHMGCYGIGISRLLGAVAEVSCDNEGIMWPLSIAPYCALVLPMDETKTVTEAAHAAYVDLKHVFPNDVVLDDRQNRKMMLKESFELGYPIVVIVGREYSQSGRVEVRLRREGSTELVPAGEVAAFCAGIKEADELGAKPEA